MSLSYEFLYDRRKRLYSLTGIMSIFQCYSFIVPGDIKEQMYLFTTCYREEKINRLLSTQLDNTELHPLILGFIKVASHLELELYHHSLRKIQHRSEFEGFIERFGGELRFDFDIYLSKVNPDLIESYEIFKREKKLYQRCLRDYNNCDNTAPLLLDDDVDVQAIRLVESTILYLEKDRNTHNLLMMMPGAINSSDNIAQALEFLGWLRLHEPNVNIMGNIPSTELQELIFQFCEEKGYSNGKSFSKEITQWLRGKGSKGIINQIVRVLNLNNRSKLSKFQSKNQNPLDRYGAVRFHALFLFLSSDNFPDFFKTHWRDLHYLTGDYLDIYFSQNDLSERVSGYEIVNQIPTLALRMDSLPALLLWEDRLEEYALIPLQELDHKEVFEVVATVVQAIRDQCSINSIADRGSSRATELRNKHTRGITMYTNYINKGNVGAMGSNVSLKGNTFHQDVRQNLSENKLTSDELGIIEKLTEILLANNIEGVETIERIEGAKYLAELAKAENKSDQEKNLDGWRKWLNSLGNRSTTVLSVLADSVTIALPLAKLLGFKL